jgi:pSer/pThr/pTyr-binding forkhead associated (FHA) protein
VVVASTEVSRRHATIAAGTDGYVLTDTSTNGVLVNGEPVAKPARLGRGDVVRIGGEELRFYADSVPAAPELPPALATLEVVSSGLLKGQSFAVRRALSHIGRGAHNDIVIADESVSDSHAKLQRREGGWFVVDMDSTNGTYVGGRRIAGEQQLVGAPDLRFGGVKFIFRASDDGGAGGPGQTRAIASLKPDPRQRTDGRPVEAPPSKTPQRVRSIAPAPAPSPAGPSRGSSVVLWIVLLGVLGVGVLLLLASR